MVTYKHVYSLLQRERRLSRFSRLLHQLLDLPNLALRRYLLLLQSRDLLVLLVLYVDVGLDELFQDLPGRSFDFEGFHLGDRIQSALPFKHVVDLHYDIFPELSQTLGQL